MLVALLLPLKPSVRSRPLSFRQTAHKSYHFLVRAMCTEDSSEISLGSRGHLITIYERIRNWIRWTLRLRLWMALVRWILSWWSLLFWPCCKHTDHIWSLSMHLHMHWGLPPSTTKQQQFGWGGGGLRSATKAGHSIRWNEASLQPKISTLPRYDLSSHWAHTSKGHYVKFKQTATTSSGCSHAMIRMNG